MRPSPVSSRDKQRELDREYLNTIDEEKLKLA